MLSSAGFHFYWSSFTGLIHQPACTYRSSVPVVRSRFLIHRSPCVSVVFVYRFSFTGTFMCINKYTRYTVSECRTTVLNCTNEYSVK